MYKKIILLHNNDEISIKLNGDSMLRLMLFLLGFGFSIIGLSYLIIYLNYLAIGYSFMEYLQLIMFKPECLLALVGLVLLSIIIFSRRDEHDIRI